MSNVDAQIKAAMQAVLDHLKGELKTPQDGTGQFGDAG